MAGIRTHVTTVLRVLAGAAALTYASLLVPGRVIALCSYVSFPEYCPVLAYGFPLPFLADSRSTSPVGSVARDPLAILIGLDNLLWPRLWLDLAFWLLVVALVRLAYRRYRRRAASHPKLSEES